MAPEDAAFPSSQLCMVPISPWWDWIDPTSRITRYSINQSDGVTAISNYLRDRTMRVFDVKKDIEVIYNSVNCDVYTRSKNSAELRAEYAPKGERLLVHLSNFRPVKRVSDVIEIFDRVHKKIPSKLLLIGDGPDRSVAEWLAVQKGLHEDVLFLGKHGIRWKKKLGIADILLMPSELESLDWRPWKRWPVKTVPYRHSYRRSAGSDRTRRQRLPRGCRRRGYNGSLRH